MNIISQQLSLPLFPSPSFDQLLQKDNITSLTITLSTRLKRSWHVKVSRITGKRTLTVPSYLENSPLEIKSALINWALLPLKINRKHPLTEIKRQLEDQIQGYIINLDLPEIHASRINSSELENHVQGTSYNLRELFDSLNEIYFQNTLKSFVRWGSYSSLTSYHTTKIAKNGSRFHLITIAGVYNHPEVPRFAIEAVMYHEMLHIAVPPFKKNRRFVIHGSDFKIRERLYEHYEKWHEWERTSLRKLARNLKKNKFHN